MTEIEYLILHGRPRAKKQGIDQARALFNSLDIQKQSIEASIARNATGGADLEGLRVSADQLQTDMRRLHPLLNIT